MVLFVTLMGPVFEPVLPKKMPVMFPLVASESILFSLMLFKDEEPGWAKVIPVIPPLPACQFLNVLLKICFVPTSVLVIPVMADVPLQIMFLKLL